MADEEKLNKASVPPAEEKVSAPKSAQPKMVEVPLEFVERATKLMELVPTMSKQIERLTAAADKSQLANFDMRNAQEIVRTVLINTWQGKVITSWKMTKDVVVRDTQNRWFEDQRIEIMMEGAEGAPEKVEMPYNPDWVHGRKQVKADIISMFTTPEGQNMVRVKLDDRQLDFDVRFVN